MGIQTRTNRFSGPARPRDFDPSDGILIVDKPSGPTSHDIVAVIRRKFGFRKVGHGGTLDPRATGLLVILVGRGTKLSNRFMSSEKTYEGTLRLGIATDTQDADGEIIAEAPCDNISRERLEEEMAKMRGDIHQIPPMVSAIKVDGVPLYKRARKGQTVERKPRLVHIHSFNLIDLTPPRARFTIHCTKGTYVRTICADIGEALGCGAHLEDLRRTSSGKLTIDQATPLDSLLALDRKALIDKIVPMSRFRG